MVEFSFGAMVACAFAVRHPSRVRSLQLTAMPVFDTAEHARLHLKHSRWYFRYKNIGKAFLAITSPFRSSIAQFIQTYINPDLPTCKDFILLFSIYCIYAHKLQILLNGM